MRVTVLLFASLREAVGARSVDLDLPEGATAAAALATLRASYPAVAARTTRIAFARNADYIPADAPLQSGDQLALIPPVSSRATPREANASKPKNVPPIMM